MTMLKRCIVWASLMLVALASSAAYAGYNMDGAADYEDSFIAAGKQYGLNPNLIKAVAYTETGISQPDPICNSYGYCGVMQINKSKGAAVYGVPRNNIAEGARHLKSCMRGLEDNVIESLACYNAGQGNLDKAKRTGRYVVITKSIPWVGTQTGKVPKFAAACRSGHVDDVCGYVHKTIDRYNWFQKRHPYKKDGAQPKVANSRPAPSILVDSMMHVPMQQDKQSPLNLDWVLISRILAALVVAWLLRRWYMRSQESKLEDQEVR